MRTRVLLFATLALAACQKAETPEQAATRITAESDAAKTVIAAANVRYGRYLTGNQPDSISMLFMEGGMMMPPNAPAVTGRDSIRATMTRMPFPPGATLSITTVDVAANGPIAIDRGTYTFTIPAAGRTPAVTVNGKYLAHWHKIGGEWQLAADLWSDDVPAMPMPPAPSR